MPSVIATKFRALFRTRRITPGRVGAAYAVVAACFIAADGAFAYPAPDARAPVAMSFHASKRSHEVPRAVGPAQPQAGVGGGVVTVTGTARGQTGYVHYFIITGPDGEPETQVGIELAGDRIAWSFPGMGVSISPFISAGQITASGASYNVEHLYGIRPFANEELMAKLRRDLDKRVSRWVENQTPYCDEIQPSSELCLSCLGFVLRVLYPGGSPGVFAVPADFKSMRSDIYTTEDLLMYLAGVRIDLARAARLKRVESLRVPERMREELVRITTEVAPEPTSTAKRDAPRVATAKQRLTARPLTPAKRARIRS